jgi:hypothetical protein
VLHEWLHFKVDIYGNLSIYEGSLFCFIVVRSINRATLDRVLGVFGKLLMEFIW